MAGERHGGAVRHDRIFVLERGEEHRDGLFVPRDAAERLRCGVAHEAVRIVQRLPAYGQERGAGMRDEGAHGHLSGILARGVQRGAGQLFHGRRREAAQGGDRALAQHVIAVLTDDGLELRIAGGGIPPLSQSQRGRAAHAVLRIAQGVEKRLQGRTGHLAQGLERQAALDEIRRLRAREHGGGIEGQFACEMLRQRAHPHMCVLAAQG